jgi:hypothetical protein
VGCACPWELLGKASRIESNRMGSCCSSITGKRKGTVEVVMIEAAASGISSISTSSSADSKKKSKRQSSGRWKKKSAAASDEGELLPENGRMVMNGASKVACLYTQQGKKGTNQDAMVVWEVSAGLLFHQSSLASYV